MSSIKRSKLKEFLSVHGVIEEGSSPEITPLSGGFWNTVYRVKTTSNDWIVKCMQESTETTRLYPNMPVHEMEALKLLSNLKIAPKFVAYYPAIANTSASSITGQNNSGDDSVLDEQAILIYDFAPGTMLTSQLNTLNRKPILDKVATLFAKQHKVDIKSTNFRQLALTPETMITAAEQLLHGMAIDQNITRLRRHHSILIRNTHTLKPKLSFLHTDAWAGNFIIDPEQDLLEQNLPEQNLSLIDWQCPAVGDASFDLWTFAFAGYNKLVGETVFNSEEQHYLIDTYSTYAGDDSIRERLDYFSPYYAYQIAAHCCQRIVTLEKDNPEASLTYQEVLELQLNALERGLL